MRSVLFLSFALTLISTPAFAGRIAIVGGVNVSEPKEPGMEYSGKNGFGGGLLMEFKKSPWFGMEFGALFLPRKYSFSTAIPLSTTKTRQGKMYEFPLLFRLHMGQMFSFGIGGYYSSATGQINEETTSDAGGSFQTLTYGDASQTTSDYGLASSVCLYFWVAPLMHFVIDARYTASIKNNHTGTGSRKFNDSQLLTGLQFGF